MEEQDKKELILWEAYNLIRTLNDDELDEVQILINRERTDRIRNNKAKQKGQKLGSITTHDYIQEVS